MRTAGMLSWSRFHADVCSQVHRDFSAPLPTAPLRKLQFPV